MYDFVCILKVQIRHIFKKILRHPIYKSQNIFPKKEEKPSKKIFKVLRRKVKEEPIPRDLKKKNSK